MFLCFTPNNFLFFYTFLSLGYHAQEILLKMCYMRQRPWSRAEDEPLFQMPQDITSNIKRCIDF